MRKPVFTPEAWEEFMEWSKEDLKILKKILELMMMLLAIRLRDWGSRKL
jgi:Txe/YoeB family toxin of Txe-Axe toxin-antitoxin module